MERVRLTKRMASVNRKADAEQPATPIDLGKNRTYHKIDEYHTFEPSLNHWEPDMRHEWKDNPRTETGHGIPKMAKVYMAAKKATKLAMMFLGEDADEEKIEKQARAFMRMGDKALTASINRWAECNGDDCENEVKAEEEVKEEVKVEAPAEEVKADEEVKEEVKVEEALAAPAEEVKAEEEVKVEEAPKAPEAEDEAEVKEEVPAEADDEEQVVVDDELIPTDVDFDEPEDGAGEADAELQACFAEDQGEGEEVAPVEAPVARKAGLKKLAGQPTLVRVASKKADELAGLWDKWDNPNVR